MHRAYFSLTNHIDQPTFVNFNLNPSSLLLPLPTTIVFHSFCTSRCTASLQSDSILAAFLSSSLHRNNSVVVVVKVGGLYYSTSSYYSHYPGHTYIYFILFFIFFPLPFCHFPPIPTPTLQKLSCLLCLSLYPSIPSVRHHPRQATAACIVCLLRCRLSRKLPVSLDSLYASISPR